MISLKCCVPTAVAPRAVSWTRTTMTSVCAPVWNLRPRPVLPARDRLARMTALAAEIGQTVLDIVVADITRLDVDAIVNAANRRLLGGGGVDGAIHRAAGPELRAACAKLGGCETGNAKITPGFRLLARHVIHTVGPVWGGGERGEDQLLAACYRASFGLAREYGLASIAFPAISTGAYGFPPDRAARIALRTVLAALAEPRSIERVVFCCFGADARKHHEIAFAELAGESD